MKVIVTQGIQVSYGGETYRNGASVDVPDAVGRRWVRNGWASTEDGPSSLPDPRGLNKANTEPDSFSIGVGQVEADTPSEPLDDNGSDRLEGDEPKPAPRATKHRRRDPRAKGKRDADQ